MLSLWLQWTEKTIHLFSASVCVCARAPTGRMETHEWPHQPGTQTGVAHSRSFRLRPSHLPSTENSSSFQEVKPCWWYTCSPLRCRPPSRSSPPPPPPFLCLSLSNLSWFWLDLMQQAGVWGEEGPSAEASPGANPSFMDPPPTPASHHHHPADRWGGGLAGENTGRAEEVISQWRLPFAGTGVTIMFLNIYCTSTVYVHHMSKVLKWEKTESRLLNEHTKRRNSTMSERPNRWILSSTYFFLLFHSIESLLF